MNLELKDGLNECTNAEYHADRKYLSSSVLKTIYSSLADYKHQYIDGNKKEFGNENALLEGSLTHSFLLEPHTVQSEYLFFPGLRKAGDNWEQFKSALSELDAKKPIVSMPQKLRVESYVKAYKDRVEAHQYLEGGQAEQTICGSLNDVPIKVRFDYINVDKGFITDIKTTGKPADKESFIATMEGLKYELSAALYCAMAEKYYGKPFDFYFIVLGKQELQCHVYKMSKATMARGRKMVNTACTKYKKAIETGIWVDESIDLCENETKYVVEEV